MAYRNRPDIRLTLSAPTKIIPVTTNVYGVGTTSAYKLPAYSITVLQILAN